MATDIKSAAAMTERPAAVQLKLIDGNDAIVYVPNIKLMYREKGHTFIEILGHKYLCLVVRDDDAAKYREIEALMLPCGILLAWRNLLDQKRGDRPAPAADVHVRPSESGKALVDYWRDEVDKVRKFGIEHGLCRHGPCRIGAAELYEIIAEHDAVRAEVTRLTQLCVPQDIADELFGALDNPGFNVSGGGVERIVEPGDGSCVKPKRKSRKPRGT